MALDREKCTTCPVVHLPACGGQTTPAICNALNAGLVDSDTGEPLTAPVPESTAGLTGLRLERGKTASSIHFGWPNG